MPARAADWIAAFVLTGRYIDSCGGLDLIRTCPCQYGPCGYCEQLGRHDRCTHRQRQPPASPLTHVQNRAGGCVATVWMSGRPCRWRCPCKCPQPEPPAVVQLGLFDIAT